MSLFPKRKKSSVNNLSQISKAERIKNMEKLSDLSKKLKITAKNLTNTC
jgi:hypothetical protein